VYPFADTAVFGGFLAISASSIHTSITFGDSPLIGFTFMVLAHLGSPGQRAVKRVCVNVMKWPFVE